MPEMTLNVAQVCCLLGLPPAACDAALATLAHWGLLIQARGGSFLRAPLRRPAHL